MSAPGAGKTALLERVLGDLGRVGVLEGDVQGSYDADRLASPPAPRTPLHTGAGGGGGMRLAVLGVALQLGHPLPRIVARFAHAPADAWSLALLLFVLAAIVGGFASPLAPPGVGVLSFRARFVLNDVIAFGLVFMLLMPAVFGTRAGDVADRV